MGGNVKDLINHINHASKVVAEISFIAQTDANAYHLATSVIMIMIVVIIKTRDTAMNDAIQGTHGTALMVVGEWSSWTGIIHPVPMESL